MSLLDKIEELQKTPESYRRKILIAVMAIIMPVVLIIWFFTFDLPSAQDDEKKVEIKAPFALVMESFTGTYDVFKDRLLSLKYISN